MGDRLCYVLKDAGEANLIYATTPFSKYVMLSVIYRNPGLARVIANRKIAQISAFSVPFMRNQNAR